MVKIPSKFIRMPCTRSDIVLIHDDLLATGGTALAALNLIRQI